MQNYKKKYLKYKLKYLKFKGGMNSRERINRINDLIKNLSIFINVSNRINVKATMSEPPYIIDCLNLNDINLNKEIYNFKIYYKNLENIDFSKIIKINDYVHIVKLFKIFNIIAGNYLSISYLMDQTQNSENLTFNKIEGMSLGQCNFFNSYIALLLLEVFDYKVLFANSIIINKQNIPSILAALNFGCVIQLQIPYLENYHFINILKNPDNSSYNIFSINGSDNTLLKTTFNNQDEFVYCLINVYNINLLKGHEQEYFDVYKALTGINFIQFYQQSLIFNDSDSEPDDLEEEEELKNEIIDGMFEQEKYFCVILGNLVDGCVVDGCVGEGCTGHSEETSARLAEAERVLVPEQPREADAGEE